mmetsp:Transcript_38910/g.75869  ORF Transcript_38910/g.75869 Transcript_38910/m.75869 type:complete len:248 (-) Transcript_38910:118-861(-)
MERSAEWSERRDERISVLQEEVSERNGRILELGKRIIALEGRAAELEGRCGETAPSTSPTLSPTASPTNAPTLSPSDHPTASPTNAPTSVPTTSSTRAPMTSLPTDTPTSSPTSSPTVSPTSSPTGVPTLNPTDGPTKKPLLFCEVGRDIECRGCQKNHYAGKYNYCDKSNPVNNKKDCEWVGGPGDCKFPAKRSVSFEECYSLCQAEDGCTHFVNNGWSCNLHLVSTCTQVNQPYGSVILYSPGSC